MKIIEKATITAIATCMLLVLVAIVKPVNSMSTTEPLDPVVEHLAKVRVISHLETAERVKWTENASLLNSEILKQPISGYGGIWINADNDRVMVGIANETTESLIRSLVKTYDIDGRVDYVKVKYDLDTLIDTKKSVG